MPRLCSFCRSPAHNKSRCERYQTITRLITNVSDDPEFVKKSIKNYKKYAHYNVCELSDYDFNETIDYNYARCQYDSRAITEIDNSILTLQNPTQQSISIARERVSLQFMFYNNSVSRDILVRELDYQRQRYERNIMIYLERQLEAQLEARLEAQREADLREARQRNADIREARLNSANLFVHSLASMNYMDANPHKLKPILEIVEESDAVATCDICFQDDVPFTGMVKTNCNHECCASCFKRFINIKPDCPFCRTKVNTVCVRTQEIFANITL